MSRYTFYDDYHNDEDYDDDDSEDPMFKDDNGFVWSITDKNDHIPSSHFHPTSITMPLRSGMKDHSMARDSHVHFGNTLHDANSIEHDLQQSQTTSSNYQLHVPSSARSLALCPSHGSYTQPSAWNRPYDRVFDEQWQRATDFAQNMPRSSISITDTVPVTSMQSVYCDQNRYGHSVPTGYCQPGQVEQYGITAQPAILGAQKSMTLFDSAGRMYLLVSDSQERTNNQNANESWMNSLKNRIKSSSQTILSRIGNLGGNGTQSSVNHQTYLPINQAPGDQCPLCEPSSNGGTVAYSLPARCASSAPYTYSRPLEIQDSPRIPTYRTSQPNMNREAGAYFMSKEVLVNEPDNKRNFINRRYVTPDGIVREAITEYTKGGSNGEQGRRGDVERYPSRHNGQPSVERQHTGANHNIDNFQYPPKTGNRGVSSYNNNAYRMQV